MKLLLVDPKACQQPEATVAGQKLQTNLEFEIRPCLAMQNPCVDPTPGVISSPGDSPFVELTWELKKHRLPWYKTGRCMQPIQQFDRRAKHASAVASKGPEMYDFICLFSDLPEYECHMFLGCRLIF